MGAYALQHALHAGAGPLPGGSGGLDPFVPLLPSMSLDSFFGGGAPGAEAAAAAAAAAPLAPEPLLQTLNPWEGEAGVALGAKGSIPSLGLVPSLDSLGSDWQARAHRVLQLHNKVTAVLILKTRARARRALRWAPSAASPCWA